MEHLAELIIVDESDLLKFHEEPDIIVKYSNQYEKVLLEYIKSFRLPNKLRSATEVFLAIVLVYAFSQNIYDDKEGLKQSQTMAKLSLSIFDQKIVNIPITFISAFTIVVLKYAELSKGKSEAGPFIELLLKNISLQMIYDKSSNILISDMLMKLIANYYGLLSEDSLSFSIDFFTMEKESDKMIEILSLKFFKVVKSQDIDFCNYCFQQLAEVIDLEEESIDIINKFIAHLQNSDNSSRSIQCYFLPILLQYFIDEIHNLIAGLLINTNNNIKQIGIQLALQFIISDKIRSDQIFFIIEMLICQLSKLDKDIYLLSLSSQLIQFIQVDFEINIEILQSCVLSESYVKNVIAITLLPIVFYILFTKLSTHKSIVTQQITQRKQILDFYGSFAQNQNLIKSLDKIINPLSDEEQQFQHSVYQIQTQFDFINNQTLNIINLSFQNIKTFIGMKLEDFLQQELIYRIQDQGQSIKKLSVSFLLKLIQKNPNQIKLLFSDILQVQDQQILAQNIFHDFVIQIIIDKDEYRLKYLFEFIQSCPVKLFESTFALLLKDQLLNQKVFSNLISFDEKGAFIILRLCLQYSKEQTTGVYTKVINMLHTKLVQMAQEGNNLYIYILYSLDVSYFKGLFDFDISQFIHIDNIEEGILLQIEKLQILQIIEKISDISQFLNPIILQLENLSTFRQDQFQIKGEAIFSKITQLLQTHTLSQPQLTNLYDSIDPYLSQHPLSSIPIYYLIYFSNDIEFRFNLFEKLINVLNQTENNEVSIKVANNTVISIISAIYAFPDEFGQFFTLIFDAQVLKTSYLIQRNILYLALDLKNLQLIKFDADIFQNLFTYLTSKNTDLKALTIRLLLQPSLNDYVVRYFRLCMQDLQNQTKAQRNEIYSTILTKMSQVNKYNLINQLLQFLPLSTQSEASDILEILYSGNLQITISEPLEKAANILKKLNLQYTVQSVLPRLMERLGVYNSTKNDELKEQCITCIRIVGKQMKIGWEEMIAQFGGKYCLELMQVKW